MKGSGGGKEDRQRVVQGPPSSTNESSFSPLSSSRLDNGDREILSLARDCPVTMLSISEKTEMSFVECLHRAKSLQRMGLLRKLDGPPRSDGLFLYLAVQRKI